MMRIVCIKDIILLAMSGFVPEQWSLQNHHQPGQSEPASMTAPVDCSVHWMGWMIRLNFICLFTLH
jgi:hypothetical protein